MNRTGLNLLKNAIKEKKNIVFEIVGSEIEFVTQMTEIIKSLDYKVNYSFITCDIETAKERNENRSDDNISAYYYEYIHLRWLIQVSEELNKNRI